MGISDPHLLFMISMISVLSVLLGRSMKKVAEKRPLLINSGGNASIEFAVAMIRTEVFVSDIHVRKWPNIDAVVPASVSPDDLVPANAFSISSIHTTAL